MEHAELQLIRDAQAGNRYAFASLYDAYLDRVYRYIYFRTHHKETAEDLAASVFVKALEKLPSFDPGKAGFTTWLYAIARNALTDHYRRQKPDVDVEDVWDTLASGEDIPADTDVRARLAKVQELMKDLPAAQREIVLLRVWDELSYAEIAEVTGKSEAASKMAFSRAVATLRKRAPDALLVLLLAVPFLPLKPL